MEDKWITYNHALIPNIFPHEEPDLSNLKALLKNAGGYCLHGILPILIAITKLRFGAA